MALTQDLQNLLCSFLNLKQNDGRLHYHAEDLKFGTHFLSRMTKTKNKI